MTGVTRDFDAGSGAPSILPYPDPARPFWQYLSSRHQTAGGRWLKQRQMQSRIRAAARKEMAVVGFQGVQLRNIADHCAISVQTIYNLVGPRDQVMTEASEEWVAALTANGRARAASKNISELLAIVGMFWSSPLHEIDYVSSCALTARTRQDPLNRSFRCSATEVVKRALTRLAAADMLRENIDPECLARQLTSTIHIAIYDWTVDRYDPGLYWREFAHGPALLLLAAVRGAEIARVERGLELIRTSPCSQSQSERCSLHQEAALA